MSFILVLICLAIERFWGAVETVRYWGWLPRYRAWIEKVTNKSNNPTLIYFSVVVPVLVVLLLVLSALAHSPLVYVIDFVVLLYSLGPNSFFTPFSKVPVVDKESSDAEAADAEPEMNTESVEHYFWQVNESVFAPLFWFVLLGPFGALLYRLTAMLQTDEQPGFIAHALSVLDWIPVRLLAFSFALVSYFVDVFPLWLKQVLSGLGHNRELLTQCARAALRQEGDMAHVLALIDRSLIVWLVVLALAVIF